MRVLITSPIFPPDLGGPSVYVPSLGRFLVERGHEVKVVAFCSEQNPPGYPFPVLTIPRGPLPLRYLRAFFTVLREARGCDVVYVQEHLALLHVLAARLRGVPVVIRIMVDGAWEIASRKGWTEEDIVTFQGKSYGWKVGLTRFLQRRWWRWSTHIISCSEFLRQILVRHHGVPPEKVQRIFNAYHGPDPSSLPQGREEARRALGLPVEGRYVLTICRLMRWKGVDGILRALARLPADVRLLIAGDGECDAEWRALARQLGVQDRAIFLGNVPHQQVLLYIRAADLFVLNSRYEGLSHTLLEVQWIGTPIVASAVCGNPEVVEHERSGLLVDPLDDRQLQAAMQRLLDDPELGQRLVQEGRRSAERFSRERTFSEVEAALARVGAA